MPLAEGMGGSLPPLKTELFATDAQAAERLLNRLARQFADSYDAGAYKEELDDLMSAYSWLKEIASESKESQSDAVEN